MTEEYKIMQGERFHSALTAWDTSRDLDWDEPGEFPVAKTLDEIRTQKLVQAILNKPDWQNKIKDLEIRSKWIKEAKEQEPKLRDEMIDYAMKELVWGAGAADPETGVQPSGIDLVWRSDTILPSDLRASFHDLVTKLENSQLTKDWHPGSDDKVLNIVHPSLFCVVYNKTKDKDGNLVPLPADASPRLPRRNYGSGNDVGDLWSQKFQWLPTEFLVKQSGEVTIESYINSLKPDSGLYPVIAKIFERVVPMFNIVLTDLRLHDRRIRFPCEGGSSGWWGNLENPPEDVKKNIIDEIRANNSARGRGTDREPSKWEIEREWKKIRGPNPVHVPEFDQTQFEVTEGDKVVDLKGHRLQVIVKIGAIHLTPEKPTFEGGNWHVEGMANEKIVATCIYYYDSENIEGDRLNFRRAVDLSIEMFEQDDDEGAEGMFGIAREEAMVQEAGGINTPAGRVLVFPNIYQHSLCPFSLADKTKPGHRKILVFFLVDPTQRIPSSSTIPPQGPLWLTESMANTLGQVFPGELQNMISAQLSSDMSIEEAKEYRLELMKERSFAKDAVTEALFERSFNLCEH